MSWRQGATLFREMWPLIEKHIPEREYRFEFVMELLEYFMDCDMDGNDLLGFHPEIDEVLDAIWKNESNDVGPDHGQ
jgi:hypothetical protein